jgi:hypothetical protein
MQRGLPEVFFISLRRRNLPDAQDLAADFFKRAGHFIGRCYIYTCSGRDRDARSGMHPIDI